MAKFMNAQIIWNKACQSLCISGSAGVWSNIAKQQMTIRTLTFHSITLCSRSFTFALWGLWGLQELQPANSKRWGSSSLASVTLQVRHNVTLLVRHNHQQLPHLSTFVTSHTSCWAWSNLQKSGLKQSACYIVCILWTYAFYDGYDFLHW